MAQVLCPIVVGRDPELAVLEERLGASRGGTGGVVFLLGEAGVGKSRLSREAEAYARELGMKALRGRAVRSAAPIPFRPLAEALYAEVPAEAPPRAPELRPYRMALARLIPEWGAGIGAASPEAPPLLVLEAALRLLRSLASSSGMLLVLEDLHWADEDSLSAVEYLADHLGREPILCLCTARSDETGPGTQLAETLSARRTAMRLSLSRLSDGQVDQMVRACLEQRPPPEVAEAVRARAEGIPFLVEELLSAYVSAGTPPADESWARALPSSYRELVRHRLREVSEEGRSVVFAAAVLGRSFDWSLLAPVTGLTEEAVLRRLREAVDAQLFQTAGAGTQTAFGFRHALAREAVLEELLPPERAELSLRAAEVIEERFPGVPGEWCEIAAGLRETGGDHLAAARHLLEAGRRALARTALSSAEATLERGRALATEDPWLRWGMGQVLLETLALAGKIERVRALGDELVPFMQQSTVMNFAPYIVAPVHLRIARGVAAAGDWPLARSHLEEARRSAARDEALRARISAFGSQVALAEGKLEEAARTARVSLATAERLGLPDVVCESLQTLGRAAFRRRDVGEAIRALRRAAEIAGERDLPSWRARALLALGTIDRCTTAELDHLLEGREIAVATEAVSTQALIELEIGRTLTGGFDTDGALGPLEACESICRRYRLPLLPHALVARAAALAMAHREAEAESLVSESLAIDPGSAEVAADVAGSPRTILALVAGDRPRAAEELELGMEHLRGVPARDPRSFPGLWALLRSLEGGADGRSEVASSVDAVHRVTQGYLAFAEAAAAGTGARLEEALERFRDADAVMASFPWDRHLGRVLAADAAARDGWGEPAVWMSETLAFFDAAGHRGLADAARRVLRRVGAPVPRRGRGEAEVPAELRARGVTSREMDVLTLVVVGLSNPEIARRLHLSHRTVESHVASLLRKTGAETRRALAALTKRPE